MFYSLMFSTFEEISLFVAFYQEISPQLADKKYVTCSVVMFWLHYYIRFSLLCSATDYLPAAQLCRGCLANLQVLNLEEQLSLYF